MRVVKEPEAKDNTNDSSSNILEMLGLLWKSYFIWTGIIHISK